MITIPSTIVGFHMSQRYAQRQSVSYSQEPCDDVRQISFPSPFIAKTNNNGLITGPQGEMPNTMPLWFIFNK